jgi:predicted Zn-dependent peptidase
MHIKNFDPYDFSKKEVGGVSVYYKNLPWAPCINIYIVFNTGAFHDPIGKEGVSHFLEHMIFDGSPKLKNKKAILEWGKKYTLDSWNAWTSFYQTVYHLKCLPENYKTVLDGMKDMIFNPYLREKDIEHERGVITQEAWRNLKNEKYLKYLKEVLDNTYHGHNFARNYSVLGWPETINKISQNDVKKWHSEKYARGNFSIILTGAVEEKHIELLKNFVNNIPKKSFDKYVKGVVGKPKKLKIVKSGEEIGDPKEQAEVSISRSMNFLPEKLTQTAELFRTLMGDILNERLRFEKGLCYSVGFGAWLSADFTQVSMNIKTDEKNIDIVQKEFWKILSEITSGKHKTKFNTLKKVDIERLKSRELLSDGVAGKAVNDIGQYDNKIITLSEEIKETEAVTYASVAKFAKEIFRPKWTVTEVILPSKK